MFEKNRKKLIERMEDNSLLVIFAGEAPYRSADQRYKFTPNRNFYYLTGIDKPNLILAILKRGGVVSETIFVEREDEVMAKWIGRAINKSEVSELSKITDTRYLDQFESMISNCMDRLGIEKIYFDLERQTSAIPSTKAQDMANELKNKYPHLNITNIFKELAKLRMVKSKEEIELIKKAAKITTAGIENCMKNVRPGMLEYQIESYFDFEIKRLGASDHAFTTICAAGKNATVLHYEDNDQEAKDGDLILFDLGAEYKYYCSDLSRTIPANGKFTQRQKQIYNIVLDAKKAVEKAAKPGLTLRELNDVAKDILAKGCIKIGLIKNEDEISKYYYHGVSHSLGLDTHDVWVVDSILQEGAVITNEPGLYIEEENIGIRLEDDLLITASGCENLSKDMIIEIEDIEKFMN